MKLPGPLTGGHKSFLLAGLILATLAALITAWWLNRPAPPPPIRIGVLHSLSGTMTISERPLVDAITLAVEEINAAGGLLGRPLEMVVADGRSDPDVFATEAHQLIAQEKVAVLFACWTSACRKAIQPVVERHQHLMFYPLQYEGLEQSPHILYTGSAPNQQIIPGVRWALERFGRSVYLVGSDYIFPRLANQMIKDLVTARQGKVLGERYLPLGSRDIAAIVADIRQKNPDVVLNTINGDSNQALFHALNDAGMNDLPLISFSVAETGLSAWGGQRLSRHYGVWSYFQSTDSAENRRFVSAFQARFGADRVTSDPIEASYIGVKLWAQAVAEEGSADPRRLNSASLLRQTLSGPSSVIAVDPQTRHLWKMVRIGKATPSGQFEEVFASSHPLRPAPWPTHRSREEWTRLVDAQSVTLP